MLDTSGVLTQVSVQVSSGQWPTGSTTRHRWPEVDQVVNAVGRIQVPIQEAMASSIGLQHRSDLSQYRRADCCPWRNVQRST